MADPRGVQFRGMDIARPINRIRAGFTAFAMNVRALLRGSFGMRSVLTDAILTLSGAVVTIARLNDSTPNGPISGYSLIAVDNLGKLWCNNTQIAIGLSGNPVSMVPFRPNASVQPWMYIADSAPDGQVTITTKFALNGAATTFACSGMLKVRSDGLVYKTGIKEPQLAPVVSTPGTTSAGSASLAATTFPWTNVGGANSTYNYGHTSAGDGTSPVIIALPAGSQTLTLTVTGTATINGAVQAPGNAGPATATFPGVFTGAGPTIVVGAFTNGSGVVLTGSSPVPVLANVGAGIALQIPAGASNFQIGVNSSANTFSANSGSFALSWTLVTSAIATKPSTLGNVTAYVWGDSPHSGPVGVYIWKNPNDSGTGNPRTIGDASVTATNNSWVFDSTPEDGTVPVQWNTLNSVGTVVGSIALFSPALESQGYQDFNAAIVGSIFIPTAGTYAFTFKNKDQIMVGVGGGATVVGGYVMGSAQQSTSVVNALPLVYVSTPSGGGGAVTQSVNITFPGTGAYQFEIDWDYWFHSGRSMVMTCNGASIPPLPVGVRTNVAYACKYRSSPTGAKSNPGPASNAQITPVLNNTVACPYSLDPQVDKVDYYRQDKGLTNFTYVATGPNTNPPTPIVDSLSDLDAAGNPTMDYDDFEPVPSIDLPQAGTCNVSGGIITWLSGGAVGGTAVGFNVRWLAGTIIQIGYPTQIAYSLIARPTSTTTMTIPGVPDGTTLTYNIAEPILAAQPVPYMFGPTDNVNFAYYCGDSNRSGTFYWSKGSNLDSAPQTNQQDITDPGEALVNGAMSGGLGAIGSIHRFWIILPNFFNAKATATGTSGSTWTLQLTNIGRGLYMPRCITVQGGGLIFFRVNDGIHVSKSGAGSRSITDDELYPLFPHEGKAPTPIVRAGITIYPPDDTLPQRQQMAAVGQYVYYDYQGTDGTRYTLVYDTLEQGWIWDASIPRTTCHASDGGQSVQGILAGCVDATVRRMLSSGTETPMATVLTAAIGGVGYQHASGFTIEYASAQTLTLLPIVADQGNGSYAPATWTLPATGGQITKYRGWFTPNKWKLLQFQLFFADATAQVFIEGFEVDCKDWGADTEYRKVSPFGDDGGFGGQA